MAQKFGGAIGGAATMWLLAAFGYITDSHITQAADFVGQPTQALVCLRALMSFIPACISLLAVVVVSFYPLSETRMQDIESQLLTQRNHD